MSKGQPPSSKPMADPSSPPAPGNLVSLEAEIGRLRARIRDLEARERNLRFTLDAMPDFVSYVGSDLRYRVCNHRYGDIVAAGNGNGNGNGNGKDLEGRLVSDVLGEEALRAIQPHVQRALRGEEVCYESWMDYRFGEGQYVEVQYVPHREADGQVEGFAVLVRNVTARKRAEEDLLAQRDLLATLVDSVPDVVCVKDGDGRWLLANNAALDLFALDAAGYEGGNDLELLSGDQLRFFRDGIDDESVWRNGSLVRAEVRYPTAADRPSYFDLIKVPLFDQEGARRYLIVVGRDVTGLQQAARAKSEFLANLSHEIRTPMNAILGYARLAQHTDTAHKLQDYLQRIGSSSDLLLSLINDVLDYSKIEAGKMQVERAGFNLREMVEESAWLMAEQAAGKGLELVLHCAPDVPLQLIGDSLRLRQVLINLLGNAIKFTRRGSVSLRVGCPGRNDGRVVVDFRVIDTGIGIPAHRLEELFDPFTQADSSHTRQFGGTGLGLAISKHLVELMGGELGVLSEPDSGSEFRFALPFERDPAAPEVPPPALPELAGRRVLLVDDNDMARGVIDELLQRLALEVTAVSGADEAMTAIHGTGSNPRYDLLLLDWDMPGVNGETLLRMLRFHGNCTRVPALLMVTTLQRQKLELAHERLLCALLDKPITLASLLQSLAHVFGVAASEEDEESRNWPPQERTLEQIAGARVLLVEDNRINQDVMREYLARCRASVTVAVNGREAVERVRQDEFDLVLMDIQMPEMDGYQATGVIREVGFDDLPVIALTAHAMEGDKTKCLAAGMNGFLSKPVTPEQLVQMLIRWARQGGTEKGEPETVSAAPPATEAALPAVLPGIDLESALHKMSGSEAILLELLIKYHEEYEYVADQVVRLLDEEKWDQARQLVHKLKGASSVLDAKRVTGVCGELEARLVEGQAGDGLVARFREAVGEVMGSLARLR